MPPNASELISAVNHPLRRRILFAYLDGSAEAATAGELAAAMDERPSRVAYHLRMLARGEILRPVPPPAGEESVGSPYGWSLAVEPEWLRLVLEVWVEADVSG
jgi:DNA-binding transcriptional ArsR family regulator